MNIAILGAVSGVAIEIERLCAAQGDALGLLAIEAEDVAALGKDLLVRGAAQVEVEVLDLAKPDSYEEVLKNIATRLGGLDAVVITYGILGDQQSAKQNLQQAYKIIDTDFTSAAMWMLAAAKIVKPSGCILVFSSVAGDRGRKSNYIYGAAKGGLALFAQGMAHDLAHGGPRVVALKPGFIITPMTAALDRRGPLWASAKAIATIAVRSIKKGRSPIVYAPWFWRWIMLIIRLMPSFVFHRTNL